MPSLLVWDLLISDLSGQKHSGVFGALLLVLIFGIGLGPCTFAYLAPVLGIVFHTALGNLEKAILLISAFGFGHCAIIVLAGSLTNLVQKYFIMRVKISKKEAKESHYLA